MKALLTGVLSAAALSCPGARANLALPHVEVHSQLAHEEVKVDIKGDRAEVTGTFSYRIPGEYYSDLKLYLPVYAAQGTPVEDFTPEITLDEQKLRVVLVKKEWETNRDITDFGALPQLEGQRVHWFMVPHVPQYPATTQGEHRNKKITLKVRYTPLIPKMEEGKHYGSITVSADRPLQLEDAGTHGYQEVDGRFIIAPADKRAIVVTAAKLKSTLP